MIDVKYHKDLPVFDYETDKGAKFFAWPPSKDSDLWTAAWKTKDGNTFGSGLTARGAMRAARFPLAIEQAFWTALVNAGINPNF